MTEFSPFPTKPPPGATAKYRTFTPPETGGEPGVVGERSESPPQTAEDCESSLRDLVGTVDPLTRRRFIQSALITGIAAAGVLTSRGQQPTTTAQPPRPIQLANDRFGRTTCQQRTPGGTGRSTGVGGHRAGRRERRPFDRDAPQRWGLLGSTAPVSHAGGRTSGF